MAAQTASIMRGLNYSSAQQQAPSPGTILQYGYDMNTEQSPWQVPGAADPSVIGNAAVIVSGDLLIYKNSSLQSLNFLTNMGALRVQCPWVAARPAAP